MYEIFVSGLKVFGVLCGLLFILAVLCAVGSLISFGLGGKPLTGAYTVLIIIVIILVLGVLNQYFRWVD